MSKKDKKEFSELAKLEQMENAINLSKSYAFRCS